MLGICAQGCYFPALLMPCCQQRDRPSQTLQEAAGRKQHIPSQGPASTTRSLAPGGCCPMEQAPSCHRGMSSLLPVAPKKLQAPSAQGTLSGLTNKGSFNVSHSHSTKVCHLGKFRGEISCWWFVSSSWARIATSYPGHSKQGFLQAGTHQPPRAKHRQITLPVLALVCLQEAGRSARKRYERKTHS